MPDQKTSPEPSMDEILASIRRILAEDERAATPASSRHARADDDVLDLTEAVNDDGSLRHIEPVTHVTPEPSPMLLDTRVGPAASGPDGAGVEPRLVSDAASEAVAASFARLSSLPRDEQLDDIVRETLRPLLQAWLDEHLPELVERLVRAEIARVVGASRPVAP
jgi:uncharacterized protein